jgi:putative transposase
MRDHVHLLLEGRSDACEFVRLMTLMRQRTAAAFHQTFGERLWQRGYYERILRNPDEGPQVIAYIAANPVTKGLVSKPEAYPYLWTPTQTYAR